MSPIVASAQDDHKISVSKTKRELAGTGEGLSTEDDVEFWRHRGKRRESGASQMRPSWSTQRQVNPEVGIGEESHRRELESKTRQSGSGSAMARQSRETNEGLVEEEDLESRCRKSGFAVESESQKAGRKV